MLANTGERTEIRGDVPHVELDGEGFIVRERPQSMRCEAVIDKAKRRSVLYLRRSAVQRSSAVCTMAAKAPEEVSRLDRVPFRSVPFLSVPFGCCCSFYRSVFSKQCSAVPTQQCSMYIPDYKTKRPRSARRSRGRALLSNS